MKKLIIPLLAISIYFPSQCIAQIYKYQDENGKWHFSDKPPAKKTTNVQTIDDGKPKYSSDEDNENAEDLKADLYSKYSPKTPIEKNTLAVVKVETMMGSGSGFFISDTGYIVTNRHVIRPGEYKGEKTEKKFDELSDQIKKNKKKLRQHKERIAREKKKLDRYKRYISGLSKSEKPDEQRRYNQNKAEFRQYEKEVSEFSKAIKKDEKQLKERRNDYNIRSSSTGISQQFSVYLKGNKKLIARLVKVSNKYDLALLKLDGYKTPYIEISRRNNSRQGTPVYAIGSPLGMQDHMTSGIITSVSHRKLITDAKILPGNSGGPLVNKEGEILGVNTQKIFNGNVMNDGFGVAISADAIKEEFSFAIQGAR